MIAFCNRLEATYLHSNVLTQEMNEKKQEEKDEGGGRVPRPNQFLGSMIGKDVVGVDGSTSSYVLQLDVYSVASDGAAQESSGCLE